MKILALEFSSARRGVAITEDDRVLGLAEATGIMPGPFELIESALRAAGLAREQIACLAAGLGPGSYTGVRSAIAIAQGWQLAQRVKLVGLSSVEVLAATAHRQAITGRIAVVINALRGEFYSATYDLRTEGWVARNTLQLVPALAVEKLAGGGEQVVTPDESNSFAGSILLRPCASALGRLAAHRSDFLAGEKLEPIYLRETTFVKAPPPRYY